MCGPDTSGHGDIDLAYRDAGQQPGVGERLARVMSGGRALPDRKFYEVTRAGLFNTDTPPDDAYPYGGLGRSFNQRRASNGMDALSISDAFGRSPDFTDPLYLDWQSSLARRVR